jgi:hypothetical protein
MNRSFAVRATKTPQGFEMDRERFRKLASALKDGEYTITVERYVANRSNRANAAYWACIVTPISEHTGYEKDEVHALLKQFCNPKVVEIVDKDSGEVTEVTIGGSTASLTMEEFSLYFKRCQQFAAEKLDVYCPDPNEEYAFEKSA